MERAAARFSGATLGGRGVVAVTRRGRRGRSAEGRMGRRGPHRVGFDEGLACHVEPDGARATKVTATTSTWRVLPCPGDVAGAGSDRQRSLSVQSSWSRCRRRAPVVCMAVRGRSVHGGYMAATRLAMSGTFGGVAVSAGLQGGGLRAHPSCRWPHWGGYTGVVRWLAPADRRRFALWRA